jgi:hypothetical protein
VTHREIVVLLLLMVLLFEADLLILRSERARSPLAKVFFTIVLPLAATFAIVVARRWRHLH